MFSMTLRPRAPRAAVALAALALGASLAACGEPELEVGTTSVDASQAQESPAQNPSGTAPAQPTTSVAADDPELEASVSTVGEFSLRLPAGWSVMAGMDSAAAGTSGAATYTQVPAAGKDQASWITDLLGGTTDVVTELEGLSEEPAVTLADGTQVFHLVHNYSDNRAHIFGTVKDDVLHLLRFGLDGTPATAAIATKSVSTAVIAPVTPVTPTPVPAPSPPSAPTPESAT